MSKFQYCVHEGRASWHQQRAGHVSAGSMCFSSKRKAETYLRRVKKLRPGEPAFIRREAVQPSSKRLPAWLFS